MLFLPMTDVEDPKFQFFADEHVTESILAFLRKTEVACLGCNIGGRSFSSWFMAKLKDETNRPKALERIQRERRVTRL